MSAAQGFAIANLNSSYFDDPKVKRLVHELQDPAKVALCLTLHQATVLESWRSGSRATATEAAPVWLPDVEALESQLRSVGMLDRNGRVPPSSWKHWFEPAAQRRENRVHSGRLGGQKSGAKRRSNGEATHQANGEHR